MPKHKIWKQNDHWCDQHWHYRIFIDYVTINGAAWTWAEAMRKVEQALKL